MSRCPHVPICNRKGVYVFCTMSPKPHVPMSNRKGVYVFCTTYGRKWPSSYGRKWPMMGASDPLFMGASDPHAVGPSIPGCCMEPFWIYWLREMRCCYTSFVWVPLNPWFHCADFRLEKPLLKARQRAKLGKLNSSRSLMFALPEGNLSTMLCFERS